MELPERVRQLVSELGDAMAKALATDPRGREITAEIQAQGFDLVLGVEVALALRERGTPEAARAPTAPAEDPAWSESDKAFLKTFRIALD